MNRVLCSVCDEYALTSPLRAEELEGLGVACVHCGAFGRVVTYDNDEGGLGWLGLAVKACPNCNCPEGDCACEDPAVVGYPEETP